ncbi:MAG: LacI family DNA-binding transcriptional regulator [Labedaea sp.]
MPDQRRRVTSVQVAQLSGVSRATVSYVLNGTPNQTISAPTRRRVFDAAESLGYTPYAPARALRSGRSDMVLLLIPEWPIGPAIARLVEELTRALAAAGLTLVVHAHPRNARPVHDLWKAITPAAVINHQALDEAEVGAARRAGIPVVAPVFQFAGRASFADFQQGVGHAQAAHLCSAGHRRLGYALPDDERLAAFADPRLAGARAACADLGLAEPMAHTVPLDRIGASTAVRAWRRARITAVCAYNDEVALAVLAGLRHRHLTAPAQLAVVGVDDIPAGALADPALTTIATGMSALGRHLAAAVVAVLQGEPAAPGPGPEIIRLVRRASA